MSGDDRAHGVWSAVKKDPRIDAHIASLEPAQQEALRAVRETLHQVIPDGEETIKYAMPCITVKGKGVAAFDAFKNHWSYFPMSGSVVDAVNGLPAWTEASKGTLRVPLDRRLSVTVVRKLVKARLAEINGAKGR